MTLYRYLTADASPLCPRQRVMTVDGREFTLSQFSEDFVLSLLPNARAELRSRSKGSLLLYWLVRDLQSQVTLSSRAGVYLFTTSGPFHPKTQELVLQAPADQRLAVLERSVPPKDTFVSFQAMKAARISMDFGLHGPWISFPSPEFGLDQAFHHGQNDLRDGVIEALLAGGIFALDEPSERSRYSSYSSELSECVAVAYGADPEGFIPVGGALGKFGPMTSLIERLQASTHGWSGGDH